MQKRNGTYIDKGVGLWQVNKADVQLRTGAELISATKPYARDNTPRSWWCVLSTSFLLLLALAATFPGFPLVARIVCSVAAGLLILRLFVIYHDQQHHAILPQIAPGRVPDEGFRDLRSQCQQHLAQFP